MSVHIEFINFNTDQLKITDLQIQSGQIVILYTSELGIEDHFLGKSTEELKIYSKFYRVYPAFRTGVSYYLYKYTFRRYTIFNYLKEYSKLDEPLIQNILNNMGISFRTPLHDVVGGSTVRMLLNIEIAFSKCNSIILNTSGLSPIGRKDIFTKLHKKVREKSDERVAIIIDSLTFPENKERQKVEFLTKKNLPDPMFTT